LTRNQKNNRPVMDTESRGRIFIFLETKVINNLGKSKRIILLMNNHVESSKTRYWLIYGLLLLVIFGVSLALRVLPMHDAVFGAGWVNMQGVDGIYHLRLVENLLAHFPFRISFDPYTFFPYGQDVYFAPLYDQLAALCAWIIGLGSPDQHTIETVAAYFPTVLGALVIVPIYFIGKTLFNRNTGLIAALISGILPGTILFRSRLGFFDHHVAEILFSTLIILFLLLALKQLKANSLSFANVLHKDWRLLAKPLIFSCLCGISLGLYLLVWVGGLLFVFILFVWAVLMFIISHLRKESTDYITILGVPIFLLSLLIVVPFLSQVAYNDLYVISLLAGLFTLIILSLISKIMNLKNIKQIYYPLSIIGIGIVGFVCFYFISPALFSSMLDRLSIFIPSTTYLTISEAQPLFGSGGNFTFSRFWSEFYTAAVIAPIAFIMIFVGVIKNISHQKILLLLWAFIVFFATVGQIRFASYLAVAFAVLCAYFYREVISWINYIVKRLFSKSSKPAASSSHNKHKNKEKVKKALASKSLPQQNNSNLVWYKVLAVSVSIILIFFVGIYPNLGPALVTAGTNAGIAGDWRDSLLWMKANTPLPFENDNYYYHLYEKPVNGKYIYPASAYGVMAWWDYGHMITQIAHRIPNANPTQAGAGSAASYFLSQDESSANYILDNLGSKYVAIDHDIAVPFNIASNAITGNKFFALSTWAGTDQSKYVEIYYQSYSGRLSAVPVYYPEYYYSQVTRLYNFHGQAVVPNNSTTVISFSEQSGRKIIQSSQTFSTYEEAATFLQKQSSPNYLIAGLSPFQSPVPLGKLAHYNEVYKSNSGITYNNLKTNSSYIEIFEYKP
jgi:dolichyl-phosphooligosaccharide-protein glycotransferase